MTLPSFIIIGAQKCGTTSLYNYMIEHPQILPSAHKELHFFNWHSKPVNKKKAEGVDWYLSQFPTIPDGKNLITGEATPDYLVDPHTPQRMFKLLPDVKLIVLLRNPVDRAVSHYYHNRRISKKREPLPFKKAIEQEPERLNLEKEKLIYDENYRSLFHRNYSYLERGIYIEQLEKWMSIFPREQFLIIKSEDFYDNPDVTLKEVFEFLGLPNYQVTNKKKYNELSYQPIDQKMRSTLAKYFQPYNQRLEEYLGIKFNWKMSFEKEQNQADNLPEKEQILMSQFKDKLHNYQSRLDKICSQLESKPFSPSTSCNGEITMKFSNDNSVAENPKLKRTVPALTKDAVNFLEKFLRQKPNAKVLEFGSGISTVWLSKLTKKLVSIEHDIEWYQKVTNYIQADNSCHPVDFRLLARPYYTVCQEFKSEFFDLIIVDGRDRVKCLEASMTVLKKGGILMLDDAEREKYELAPNLLKNWQLTKTVGKTKARHTTYWWQKPDSDGHEKQLTEVKPQAKIEILDISFSEIDSQNLLKFHIDRPKIGDKIDSYNNQIEIIGWILGKKSQPVAVEILSNGKFLQKVFINQKRPGVAKAYPQIPQAKTSGFVANIGLTGLPKESELTLQAILKNRKRVPLGSIKLNIKPDKSIGVIYIATGEKYIREACQSVASLKAQMPQMPITIFADREIQNSNFEQVVVIEKPHYNHVDKVQYMYASPYDYTLFIDTDTYISADFSEIFALLDKFDIGAAHAPLNKKGFQNGVPESFQQFNSGVVLFKKSPEVEQFFSNWSEWYNPPNFDQPTFREALYKSKLRIATLPPEYNCRFPFPGTVFGTVKILHGRHKNLPLVAQKINSKTGLRVINPRVFKKLRE